MISLPITINVSKDPDGNLTADLIHDDNLSIDQVVEVLNQAAGLLSRNVKGIDTGIEITNHEDVAVGRRRILYPNGVEHTYREGGTHA